MESKAEATRRKAKNVAVKVSRYKRVFESPDGRKVLLDLMQEFGFMASTYNGNVNDAMFNEGSRNVILYIFKNMKSEPDKILEYIEKSIEERQEEEYYE